ncbi:MAG TPA: FHA domain-containing protein [Streptosporangiaceae bacterium]
MRQLVVLEPGSDRGRRIPLDRDYLVVGRESACDVRFDNPHVSRTHAALRRHGDAVYVEDLGSFGGTFVNGAAAITACELHVGDLLTFASVTARLESGGISGEETITMVRAMPARPAGARVAQRIDEQPVAAVSNAVRQVAATRTKARRLAGTGLLMLVVGFGVFAAAADLSPTASLAGREVGGIPVGLAGGALAALGATLLIVGIVLRALAASRRK